MDIIIATNNKGKADEFKRILLPFGINALSLKELNIDADPEETGTTFAQNSKIKAEFIKNITNKAVIADDSGLCVDFLNGAPGVYSARFASDCKDFEKDKNKANNNKLLNILKNVDDEKRQAKFVCEIYCVFPNNDVITAKGEVYGKIAKQTIGENGFGYDPLFVFINENGEEKPFGLMTPKEKDLISHRGKALKSFIEKFENYLK